MPYSTVSFPMTLSKLEWLSKTFNDMKRRAVSLQQLSFLFHMPAASYEQAVTPEYRYAVARVWSFCVVWRDCIFLTNFKSFKKYIRLKLIINISPKYIYTLCSKKKHVTTFLMISWSSTVRLKRFLAHLLLRVHAIDRCFYFPTSPISCSYFTVGNCQDLNISKN